MRTSPISGKPCGKHGCSGHRKRDPDAICDGRAIEGTDRCRMHAGVDAVTAKAQGAVVAAVRSWGLGDSTVDPGEVLLRLVTQSAVRAQMYADLLQEAYEAAERLRTAHEAEDLLLAEPELQWSVDSERPRPERAGLQQARQDLERIFNVGGVGALIGNTYSDTKSGELYASGEAIRGLAKLEADERERCANFATKAVAAGLAERQVRIAERQAGQLVAVMKAILSRLGLDPGDPRVAEAMGAELRLIAGGKVA